MRHKLAYALLAVAILLGSWVVTTLLWKEPVTYVKVIREQRKLVRELDRLPMVPASEYRVRPGHAAGRIKIPRLDLNVVFVEATATEDLAKGPGHYRTTDWPGEGGTVAIAGHRTTYGAWFRHVDDLRRGDLITLKMPYGTFRYVVTGHEIVDDMDWSILKGKGERLVLSSCHPIYSSAQRYIVYARPTGG